MNYLTIHSMIQACEGQVAALQRTDLEGGKMDPHTSIEPLLRTAHFLKHLPLEALVKCPPFVSPLPPTYP